MDRRGNLGRLARSSSTHCGPYRSRRGAEQRPRAAVACAQDTSHLGVPRASQSSHRAPSGAYARLGAKAHVTPHTPPGPLYGCAGVTGVVFRETPPTACATHSFRNQAPTRPHSMRRSCRTDEAAEVGVRGVRWCLPVIGDVRGMRDRDMHVADVGGEEESGGFRRAHSRSLPIPL